MAADGGFAAGFLVRRQFDGGAVLEVETPGGFAKALKTLTFEKGVLRAEDIAEFRRLSAVRHPYLAAVDAFEHDGCRLRLLTELADGTLADEFAAARGRGLPGVPRGRLLSVLREVAEALDFFHARTAAPHLGVAPENILLVAGHAKLAEPRPFPRVVSAAPWTAPEALAKKGVPASDQFALAACYVAMLGGAPPFAAAALPLLAAGAALLPNLGNVPAEDHAALRTALASRPERRHRRCAEFIAALAGPAATDEAGREELPPTFAKPRSRTRISTATTAATLVSRDGGDAFRTRIHSVAERLGWTLSTRAPTCFALACQGGQRGFRPMLGLNDPFLVHVEYSGRPLRGGWLVSAAIEHLGDRLPEEMFELHAKVLYRRLVSELALAEAPGAEARSQRRRRYSGRAVVEPRSGPLAGLRLPCAGFDLARRGAGLACAFQVPNGPAVVELEGVGVGLRGRIVRCSKLADGQYRVGIAFALDVPDADARLFIDLPTERNTAVTQVVGGR